MIPVNFPSKAHESKFKRILGQMSTATVSYENGRVISHFRPENLLNFEQRLHANGLKNCPTTNAVIKYLARFPDERIEIIVER